MAWHSCAHHAHPATWLFPSDAWIRDLSCLRTFQQAVSAIPAFSPLWHVAFCHYLVTGSLVHRMSLSIEWKLRDRDTQGLFFSYSQTHGLAPCLVRNSDSLFVERWDEHISQCTQITLQASRLPCMVRTQKQGRPKSDLHPFTVEEKGWGD